MKEMLKKFGFCQWHGRNAFGPDAPKREDAAVGGLEYHATFSLVFDRPYGYDQKPTPMVPLA